MSSALPVTSDIKGKDMGKEDGQKSQEGEKKARKSTGRKETRNKASSRLATGEASRNERERESRERETERETCSWGIGVNASDSVRDCPSSINITIVQKSSNHKLPWLLVSSQFLFTITF
jgi:hypothetical protein